MRIGISFRQTFPASILGKKMHVLDGELTHTLNIHVETLACFAGSRLLGRQCVSVTRSFSAENSQEFQSDWPRTFSRHLTSVRHPSPKARRLSSVENASFVREGRSGATNDSVVRNGVGCGGAASRWATPRIIKGRPFRVGFECVGSTSTRKEHPYE